MAGRGCSSKEKLYREHCEVHEMDGMIERFCYCSFNLCNTASPVSRTFVSHSRNILRILLFGKFDLTYTGNSSDTISF